MIYKFNCNECGDVIITKFVKPGEIAKCPKCGTNNTVPDTAGKISSTQTDDEYYSNQHSVLRHYDTESSGKKEISSKKSEIQESETGGCIEVLRFMAWVYLAASIAGAVAVWIVYGSVLKYPDTPSLGNVANPFGIAQGFALLIQGLLLCPFFLCIATITENSVIQTGEQRKAR